MTDRGQCHGVVCWSRTRRAEDLTQSGEEEGVNAGPPWGRARLHEWWPRRAEGTTCNDVPVVPTGEKELEPDPLGEEHGSGSEGVPRGASTGLLASVNARCRPGAADLPDC